MRQEKGKALLVTAASRLCADKGFKKEVLPPKNFSKHIENAVGKWYNIYVQGTVLTLAGGMYV